MTVNDLEELFDYCYWANRKLLGVISQLTPEQFTQPMAGSYGSIRNTMVHVLSAEWGWLSRCGGPERGPRLNPGDYRTVESLVETWNKVEMYVRGFLSKLEDEELTRDVQYTIDGTEKRSTPTPRAIATSSSTMRRRAALWPRDRHGVRGEAFGGGSSSPLMRGSPCVS